jgi:hypothetical protein
MKQEKMAADEMIADLEQKLVAEKEKIRITAEAKDEEVREMRVEKDDADQEVGDL